jgi:heme exporter protein B
MPSAWRSRRALLHRPSSPLDEPFSGLDPQATATLEALLLELRASGHAIVRPPTTCRAPPLGDRVVMLPGPYRLGRVGGRAGVAIAARFDALVVRQRRRTIVRAALAILRKDLRIEWRTRESVSTLVALGVLCSSFTIAHDPRARSSRVWPRACWATFVFTGLLGVQRSFLLERDQDCLAGLLMAPIDPAAIFVGKLLANLVLLGIMQAIVVPLVALLLQVDFLPVLPGLVLVLTLGNVGFAAGATLFAAVAARTRAREVLLPLLLLPLVLAVLIAGVKATQAVLAQGVAGAGDAIRVLVAFDVVFTVAGWMLFAYVVRD